ncbi:DUF3098 domain-containing protein [Amniculibacterium sp. G2-70]|uniref:DUF3098 domain-containing protein n=1 Tax=Amniculibacterium sp. G2-70 TaxID=2767188 RepID=UPI0016547646|nr:DUF3098 domain-containing protein [Amniculibacterium sp. G2-70]
MAKKNTTFSADQFGSKNEESTTVENLFYFGKENYKWMLIGIAFIALGFLLMLGSDANTIDGKLNPNEWNEGIFSIRRIRIAPLLVILGFGIEVYAILKRNK